MLTQKNSLKLVFCFLFLFFEAFFSSFNWLLRLTSIFIIIVIGQKSAFIRLDQIVSSSFSQLCIRKKQHFFIQINKRKFLLHKMILLFSFLQKNNITLFILTSSSYNRIKKKMVLSQIELCCLLLRNFCCCCCE